MIRSLIVDDSEIVRRGIRLLLENERDVEVIGEAGDGPEAVERISQLAPDLIFLDVQMPGFDGFEVLDRVDKSRFSSVIFVTAFDQYALKAFEANALSYLLKPITPVRFRAVIQRARQLLGNRVATGRQDEGLDTGQSEAGVAPSPTSGESRVRPSNLQRLTVKDGDRFVLLKMDEVDWIASVGEYVRLHTRKRSFLTHIAISELEQKLDPQRFARIHRSAIVNLDRIREIRTRSHGDCDVLLHDGTVLRLSRSYRHRVFLGQTET